MLEKVQDALFLVSLYRSKYTQILKADVIIASAFFIDLMIAKEEYSSFFEGKRTLF